MRTVIHGAHGAPYCYDDEERGIDDAVKKVETMIADQYEKGGITATAKHSVDKALDRLSRDVRRDQP